MKSLCHYASMAKKKAKRKPQKNARKNAKREDVNQLAYRSQNNLRIKIRSPQ